MSIKIEIYAETAAEARRQMADLLGKVATEIAETTGVTDTPLEQPPKGRAPRAGKSEANPPSDTSQKPSDTSTTATTADPDGSADTASPSDDAPADEPAADGTWDYATQIKPAVLRVSQKLGREGVISLLEPFKVANAKDVPAERHGELMAAIDKLLEA